jgi:nitrate/nitrite transporter NarK
MYLYGGAGLLVAALLWFYFRNRPEEPPSCNRAEQELIVEGRPASAATDSQRRAGMIPILRFLGSFSLWCSSASQFFTNLGWLFLVQLVPRYLMEMHQVPILERGAMATAVLSVGIVGMLAGGTLTDRLVRRCGLRWGRSLPMSLSRFTAAAGFLLCLWFASTSDLNRPWLFTAAFALVAFSTDLGNPATWAFMQDVGGRHVGSVLGWGNMWGNFGAFVAPLFYFEIMGENPTEAEWSYTFAFCALAFVISGLAALPIDATRPIVPLHEER